MKIAGIIKKIREFLETVKKLLITIKKGIAAIFNGVFSLVSGIKVAKRPQSISRISNKNTAAGHYVDKPSFLTSARNKISNKIDFLTNKFFGHFPAGKRRHMLFAFGGLCCLLIVLVISAIAVKSGKSDKSAIPERIAGIPQEELFYPTEPDFLPDFILEREPRRFWTVEDINPYWKIPADNEYWQREIKLAVDKLMEGIP